MKVGPGRSYLVLGGLALALVALSPPAWRRIRLGTDLREVRQSLRTDRLSDAMDALSRLQGERPANAEIFYLSGVCRRRLTEISEARQLLAKAEKLGWPRKQILLQQAMCDFASGDTGAVAFLMGSLEDSWDDDTANEIYECLVRGYLSGLHMRQAAYCIDLWLQWRPEAVAPRKLKAEILHAILDREKEAEEYRELLRIAPDDFEVHLKFGELLMDTRSPAEALEQFRRCHELSPDDARVKMLIAACQRSLGELPEAETLLRECLDGELFGSDRTFALVELGQVALGKRSFGEAADYLQEALEAEPANRNAHHALGLALVRLGQKEEGEKHLDWGKRIDDQNDRMDELMHQIVAAPDNPEPRAEAGEILLDQQVYDQAYLWLLSALRCDKTHKRTHEALARYYSAKGKPDAAERHLAWAEEGGGSGTSPGTSALVPSVVAPSVLAPSVVAPAASGATASQ